MSRAGESHAQPELAPAVAGLPGEIRRTLDQLASMGFRHVQLSATQPGLRPRELDNSARRDLLATLRRRELTLSGLDLWIPPSHFDDPGHVDRAVSAALAGIEFAADLGRVPLSMTLPKLREPEADREADDESLADEAIRAVFDAAHRAGVPIADHHVPIADRPWDEIIGIGIDPAAWLATGVDPVDDVHRHAHHLIAARLCDLLTTGMRGPTGTRDGRLNVTNYCVALTVAGYARPVVIDTRQWSDPWSDLRAAAAHWHRVLP